MLAYIPAPWILWVMTQIWLSSCHYPGLQRTFWTYFGHPWQSCPVFDSHPTRRQGPTWGVPMAWKNLLVDTKISIRVDVIFVVGVKKSLFMSVWYLSYQLVPSCFRPLSFPLKFMKIWNVHHLHSISERVPPWVPQWFARLSPSRVQPFAWVPVCTWWLWMLGSQS